MTKTSPMLTDQLGRQHNYLRLSLTDKCNLRCSYCMPEVGYHFAPSQRLMQADEIFRMATLFVKHGVDKIRLTGGEPLVRKDFSAILEKLHELPAELSITTNGILVNRYIRDFKQYGIQKINVSLDSLKPYNFLMITNRDQFKETFENIQKLIEHQFQVKVNCVLMKDVNEDEIIDFIELTRKYPIAVRFIEFMPFDGNQWDRSRLVTQEEIIDRVTAYYSEGGYEALPLESNFTTRNFKVHGYAGSFGVISSISNPFCSTCNRIRLTADGKLKNCLFSSEETNLLEVLRNDGDPEPLIAQTVRRKKAIRAGMNSSTQLDNTGYHSRNRSMIAIGG